MQTVKIKQVFIDRFYKKHGDCCAGCDYWRWHNSIIGDCIKSAPVSSDECVSMLGISSLSFDVGAGHVMTPRDHLCGDFVDSDKPIT